MALGKPAIAAPTRLELRPIADAVSNVRQRIEALEALLNTTSATASTTVFNASSQIAALQQAVSVLTAQIAAIGTSSNAVNDASLTIAQQAMQRRAPPSPPPAADSLGILATQVFGA
jgi:hypothetical protein